MSLDFKSQISDLRFQNANQMMVHAVRENTTTKKHRRRDEVQTIRRIARVAAASDLAERVFVLSQKRLFRGYGSLRNQLERSMLSISNNIAEGFERGSTQELINFVHIARGSAGEVRSMLILLSRMAAFATLTSEILDLKSRVESISRQLRGWVDSLQNTSIKGPRYLNDKVRQMEQRKRERDEFLRELRSNLSKGSP